MLSVKVSGLARIFHELLSRDHETGNPLAGLSGLSRRSFSEDGSVASAKKQGNHQLARTFHALYAKNLGCPSPIQAYR